MSGPELLLLLLELSAYSGGYLIDAEAAGRSTKYLLGDERLLLETWPADAGAAASCTPIRPCPDVLLRGADTTACLADADTIPSSTS